MITRSKIRCVFCLMITIVSMVVFQNCGGGDPSPSPPEETAAQKNRKTLTSGVWTLQSVTVDDVDKTPMYAGMTLSFTSSSFTATHGAPVWPATGAWTFTDESGTAFSRPDGVDVSINDLQSNKLVLGLTWDKTTLAPGRQASIAGKHIFSFTK